MTTFGELAIRKAGTVPNISLDAAGNATSVSGDHLEALMAVLKNSRSYQDLQGL